MSSRDLFAVFCFAFFGEKLRKRARLRNHVSEKLTMVVRLLMEEKFPRSRRGYGVDQNRYSAGDI